MGVVLLVSETFFCEIRNTLLLCRLFLFLCQLVGWNCGFGLFPCVFGYLWGCVGYRSLTKIVGTEVYFQHKHGDKDVLGCAPGLTQAVGSVRKQKTNDRKTDGNTWVG